MLVVDDEPRLAAMVALSLERAGFCVRVVHDGEKALLLAERERFDLLLTDLLMPGLNGEALARLLRAEQSELPVLLMTAAANPTLDQGDWMAVLRKPFTIADLIAAVEGALSPTSPRLPPDQEPALRVLEE